MKTKEWRFHFLTKKILGWVSTYASMTLGAPNRVLNFFANGWFSRSGSHIQIVLNKTKKKRKKEPFRVLDQAALQVTPPVSNND